MNITILSLHFIHFISKSPSFSTPLYQLHAAFNFQNCKFKYSLTNTYSSNSKNFLYISKTNFHFFLETPIKIEETYVTNAHVKFNRVAIYDTSFICKDSTFSYCQSMFGKGGAILSLSSTILNNCFFDRCESEIGGAIYSGSDIDYFSTTFINCIGIKRGGCVCADHPEKIIISYCNFGRSISGTGGALAASSYGQSTFRYSNMSSCGSFISNGAFDLAFLSTEQFYLIFDQCFASKSTSGIKFFMNKGISIKSALFVYMISSETQKDEGSILTIIDPLELCTISHCSFSKTQKMSGYSIFAKFSENYNLNDQSKSQNAEIKIINCCFTYARELEFNNDTITVVNETNQQSSFSSSCDDFIIFMLPRKIGYQEEIKEITVPLLDRLIQKYTIWFISSEAFYLILIGFTFGFVLWLVFICFFKRPRHHRNRQRRAFQML